MHKVVNIFHVLTGVLCSAICPQSVENCVCVLHNLTYQLETEAPAVFSKINTMAAVSESRANANDIGPIGCFSNQSRKIQQEVSNVKSSVYRHNCRAMSVTFHLC